MGDPRGPEYGWSPVLPTAKGWYEIAQEEQIDEDFPVVLRVWFDGRGGSYVPREISKREARALGLKKRQVVADNGGSCVAFLPVYGSLAGSYFRALGPLLKVQGKDVWEEPEAAWIPPFQRPERYMTPEQKREAGLT